MKVDSMEDVLSELPLFAKNERLKLRLYFLIIEWQTAYPNVDIKKQLGWAHAWVSANGRRAPKKDLVRFLNTWMKRESRMTTAHVKPSAPAAYHESKPPEEEIMTAEDFAKMRQALKK